MPSAILRGPELESGSQTTKKGSLQLRLNQKRTALIYVYLVLAPQIWRRTDHG